MKLSLLLSLISFMSLPLGQLSYAANVISCTEIVTGNSISKLLEKYEYANKKRVKEIPGSTFHKSVTSSVFAICSNCKSYLENIVKYLSENTNELPHFEYSKKKPKLGDGVIANLIISKDGKPLGAYVYLIREFQETGNPSNRHNNWVNGYFDAQGTFMGRGENFDPSLSWSFY